MFTYDTTVKLHQTDAAGIVFFARYFDIAHDAYEAFMKSIGFGFDRIIQKDDFLLLIVHAEADYKQSLAVSGSAKVQMAAEKIGRTSFVLKYEILDSGGRLAGELRTVHVAVAKDTGKKIRLPEKFRAELETIR